MALSKCIKLLQHYTEDASQKPVALAQPYDPNFTSSSKLSAALAAAMSESRPAERFRAMSKIGISTFEECNVKPFRLGVALVDLTGPARLAQPEYAGFNDTTIISCASIFKLAPMIAAHQLKFDVLAKVATAPSTITDTAKKLTWAFGELTAEWKSKGLNPYYAPNLREIIVVTTGGDIDFHPTFDTQMRAITGASRFAYATVNEMNQGAWHLITRLQWTYIASVMLQTGITDTTDGGLWVCGVGTDTKNYWICDADGALVTPTSKSRSPQQITAKSGARFLSLVTQEVLISEQIAKDFRQVVDDDLGWLKLGLNSANSSTGSSPSTLVRFNPDLATNLETVRVFGKPGAFGAWAGEALGVERNSALGPLRYVVVAVTEQFKAGIDYNDMLSFVTSALIPMLDGVIVTNNTP
jgi:hypothetical protein